MRIFVRVLYKSNTETFIQISIVVYCLSLVSLERADQSGGVLRVLLLFGAEDICDLLPGPAQRQLYVDHQHEAAAHQQRHKHNDLEIFNAR